MINRPFSPETLAERWGCSAEKIRRMYKGGSIAGFRLGKLIRIPATEVDRVECLTIALPSTEVDSPSLIQATEASAFASRLARMTEGSQKLALVTSGARAPHPSVTG